MPGGGQAPAIRLDRENGDAVVAAVRAVKELAGWMHLHFGAGRIACKSLRECGNGLNRFQDSAL